jgi:hypothetical protein
MDYVYDLQQSYQKSESFSGKLHGKPTRYKGNISNPKLITHVATAVTTSTTTTTTAATVMTIRPKTK